MKLNITQFIFLNFVFGWVIGQLFMLSYTSCLVLGIMGMAIATYLNNVHQILFQAIKKYLKPPK